MSKKFWSQDFPTRREKILSFLRKKSTANITFNQDLPSQLLIASDGDIQIFYSPFDLVKQKNQKTKILIVGITPGIQQACLAIESFFEYGSGNAIGFSKSVREKAAFAGSLRSNMIKMLDELELPGLLGIESSSALFKSSADLMSATSLLKFPVFYQGENYRGGSPNIDQVTLLSSMVDFFFCKEILGENDKALIIPLGSCVQKELRRLAEKDSRIIGRVLWGFPHPSGQNGHRMKIYRENFESMKKILKNFQFL